MRIPHSITLFTATALLTAAASVGQPQSITPEDQNTTTSGTPSPTTDTTSPAASSTPSGSTSGYGTTRTDTTDTTGTTSGAASSASGAYGTSGTAGAAGTAGTMDRDTSSSAADSGSSSASLQGQDAEFVRKALEGGREEVQNAQLALQHAQRPETRSAASMMLEDHQRANQQLEQLAQRKGLSTTSASAQSDEARSGSSTAGSADFDSRFITDEIKHHRDSIALFRQQASAGSDPDLRQFATDSLPKLEHHLEVLESANNSK